ncbi:PAS domain S-box protein [Fodinibius halophilus]|uniref:PAS domain S-box protein n=1 Tax=Fodinibius halophilus TaxID=1736908 RepID=A0A6M1T140_9BACT|nr:PAS domain S-box protein [Fodinibius halophilus]NGP87687.1 PAS domain S-box protein [Fodinibius halophilus]
MNRNPSELRLDPSLLDNLVAQIAIIDSEGKVLKTNSSWDTFGDNTSHIARTSEGKNYFNSLQRAIEYGNDYALKLLLGFKKVINGTKESFTLSYPDQNKDNTFWFKQTIRPCQDKQQYLIINEDVSASVGKEHRQKLHQSRYQIQFEQSLDGILITDTDGKIIDANPAACKILGRNHTELINCTRKDIVDVSDPKYQQALSQREKSGEYQLETTFLHKDGSAIPVEISSRAYRTPLGKVRAIVSFKDISQRKKIESDLVRNKHFIESILDSIPGAFFVLNSDREFVRWNKNMTTNLGYTDDELKHTDALEFVIDNERPKTRQGLEKCLAGEELTLETRALNKNDEVRDYYISAKRFIEDGNKYIVGAALDMTTEKRIKRENQQTQRMQQQLFDNAPVGITIVDADNNVQSINKSFEEIFNYSEEEVLQKPINELVIPDHKKIEAQAVSQATFDGETLKIKSVRSTKDGKEVPVLIGSVPVSHEGEIIAIYGLYVDISQQQEYQNKIEEALKEKETLLAELHHRVKNNLALINSLLELQVYDSDDPEFNKQLQDIKNRILTISSIHETLYKNGKFNSIPFQNFIDEFISDNNIQQKHGNKTINLKTDIGSTRLNIDQSIPCGLLLNEVLSLLSEFSDDTNDSTDISIRLREYGKQVHLIIDGYDIVSDPEQLKHKDSLHNLLINPLTKQLDGQILWPNNSSSYQKFELIFTKQNGNGPARNWLPQTT